MDGQIIKINSNQYTVKYENTEYICNASRKLIYERITPMVGDNCIFSLKDLYITKILPRKNSLERPSIANVDNALIITSVKEPKLDLILLDKLITIITLNNIKPIICLTKLDLLVRKERKDISNLVKYYQKNGYTVLTNKDKIKLKKLLKNKITVLTGQSGSGKSSLLNSLDKNLKLETNPISKSLNRGIHTTRCTTLYNINNAYIVDTPGFSKIDFKDIKKVDIRDTFNEFKHNKCEYQNCMHHNEDICDVKDKVTKGIILKSRYNNYLKFISEK